MKRTCRRMLLTLISLALLVGTCALPIGVLAAGGEVSIQNGTGSRGAIQITQSLSYRAKINGEFSAFSFAIPTYNTSDAACTLSLYAWKGSFESTIAEKPIASKDFVNLVDNAVNSVSFDAQPAGEYLFHIDGIKGQVGVWANTGVQNSKGFLYQNGIEKRGEPELKINFTDIPAEPFGTCEASAGTRIEQSPIMGGTNDGVSQINDSAGMLLHMTAPFVSVEFKLATYLVTDLEITVSLHKWDKDYDTTLKGKPVAEERITMVDNAYQGINFAEQPAGQYLALLSKPSGICSLYYYAKASECLGVIFRDGSSLEVAASQYPQCRVTFTKDMGDKAYFLPCESSEEDVSGDHVAPPAYVIPEDSLIYTHPVMPDTWVFTDGLGRVSLTNKEVGAPRDDKTLAMFFWTWHLSGTDGTVRHNVQELSEKYPDAMRDYDHKLWNGLRGQFGWNESIYGNYRSDDTWVLRRQAELLTNAGVDVIFTDNTNSTNTWRAGYTALMETWSDAMEDGVNTPKLSFMLPFAAGDDTKQQLYSLYSDIFRNDKHQNLWFYRDGKPMLMAHPDSLSAEASNMEKEILNFFTFRANYPGYINSNPQPANWGWLSTYPQAVYYADQADIKDKKPEQITVGVAMNHDYKLGLLAAMSGNNIMGRSYTSTYQDRYVKEGAEASKWGYNFAEQWSYALKVDPQVVFVTGWNEWTAGRYSSWPDNSPAAVENAFPDQYNDEFSRDIEPTKGALKDHYYYQLVNFSRQYQGARPIPTPSGNATIDMTAGADQWKAVEPYYAAYIGNTENREAQGYGQTYTETSGRNDIVGAQVARDGAYVYFHVECAEDITPYTDALWMNLYIDAAGDGALDGWNSFDYVVNKSAASEKTLVLEKFTGEGYASEKVADVEYTLDGRYLTVKIAKADLGLSGDNYTLNFAWTDNVHDEGDYEKFSGDIMDFYISGDVAPGGRFKYSFISTAANAATQPESEPSESDTTASTNAATPTDPAVSDTREETNGCGGCSSAVGGVACLMAAAAAAVALRKKED